MSWKKDACLWRSCWQKAYGTPTQFGYEMVFMIICFWFCFWFLGNFQWMITIAAWLILFKIQIIEVLLIGVVFLIICSASEHAFKAILTSLPKPGGEEFGKFYSLPALNDPRIGKVSFTVFCTEISGKRKTNWILWIEITCWLYDCIELVFPFPFLSFLLLVVLILQTVCHTP